MAAMAVVEPAGPLPKRPVGSLKWNEVRERVQHSDGSVRTSPPFKSGGVAAASPQRPAAVVLAGVGRSDLVNKAAGPAGSIAACSSRGGSSRGGSSGKSSRSSSRDALARDGDISSRCSSGGGWDTSTNSSEVSRPRTPPDMAPSPSGSHGLLMPDPIRTNLMLPPALFDDEHGTGACVFQAQVQAAVECEVQQVPEPQPGIALNRDPYCRDAPRRSDVKTEWTVEPLVLFLKDIVMKIDANVHNHGMPTSAEKLDSWVSYVVSKSHSRIKNAPRQVRHSLQGMFTMHFRNFWDFAANSKVRTTTPEELRGVLVNMLAALKDFGSPVVIAQPRILRGSGTYRRSRTTLPEAEDLRRAGALARPVAEPAGAGI